MLYCQRNDRDKYALPAFRELRDGATQQQAARKSPREQPAQRPANPGLLRRAGRPRYQADETTTRQARITRASPALSVACVALYPVVNKGGITASAVRP